MKLLLLLGFLFSAPAPHPRRVVELRLAGLRPGRARLPQALRRYGPGWRHPSRDESDIYFWQSRRVALQVEVNRRGLIRYISIQRHPARHPRSRGLFALAHTSHGLRLGDRLAQALAIYGRPFFQGPSLLNGRPADYVSFKFSWAGPRVPQILACSFVRGRLVKMTLSADYY